MSYSLYLVRSGDWMEETAPITLDKVEPLLKKLPQGFRISRSRSVKTTLPDGSVLSVGTEGGYVEYFDDIHADSRVRIFFSSGCPKFTIMDERQLLPIFDLVDALGARIQGEDMEFYTWEELFPERNRQPP